VAHIKFCPFPIKIEAVVVFKDVVEQEILTHEFVVGDKVCEVVQDGKVEVNKLL